MDKTEGVLRDLATKPFALVGYASDGAGVVLVESMVKRKNWSNLLD